MNKMIILPIFNPTIKLLSVKRVSYDCPLSVGYYTTVEDFLNMKQINFYYNESPEAVEEKTAYKEKLGNTYNDLKGGIICH